MSSPETIRLAPPPRNLPWSLRCHLLFGGVVTPVFGWVFLAMAPLFFWGWSNADLTSFYYFRGDVQTATGVVTESWQTLSREGRSSGSRFGRRSGRRSTSKPIYANAYSFVGPDGFEHHGVSYAAGKRLAEGNSVTIEFPRGNPAVSRIQGMRRARFGPLIVGVVIFPLVGLGFALGGLIRGVQASRLLVRGKLGWGVLKAKTPTASRVSKARVYRLRFEFIADDGQPYRVIANTYEPHRLKDQRQESVLYDPARPSDAVLLDSLPGSPAVDSTGNFQTGSLTPTRLILFGPVFMVLTHLFYLWFTFFR